MPYRKRQISFRLSKIKRSLAALNGHKLLIIVMAALLVPTILPRPTHADGCILDLTFHHDGKVITDFGADEGARDIAIQPDGKIIAAGGNVYGTKSALARYNTDGSLDLSFGKGGKVITSGSDASAVALQADGKIVTVGEINFKELPGDSSFRYGFGAIRYNHDGSLDISFGQGGKVGIDSFFSGTRAGDKAVDVVIQPDGKIVIAGQTNDNYDYEDVQVALARLNSDGTLDTSFGGDGTVTTLFGASFSRVYANSVALQPDGKIVVGGYYKYANGRNVALARYHTDGRLDQSFDGDGRVVTILSPNTDSETYETLPAFVAIQPDGKILAAGTMELPPAPDYSRPNYVFALVRYKANGSLDETFGDAGKVNTDFSGGTDIVSDLALQADGKIVLAGQAGGLIRGIGLARYLPDGSPDNTFDTDGKLVSRFACDGVSETAVAIQADGKIVAAGTNSGNFLLARYPAVPSSDGTPRLVSLTIDNPVAPGIPNRSIIRGSVSLCGVAPPGGLEVMLTNKNEAAIVPASVTVPAGETTACFSISTKYVSARQRGIVTAQQGGVSKHAWIVVRPLGLREFSIHDYYVDPHTRNAYLYLEGPAPPGGTTVTISSSQPALASPMKEVIKFPAGTDSQSFTIRVGDVSYKRFVYFKAKTNGNTKTAVLTIYPSG